MKCQAKIKQNMYLITDLKGVCGCGLLISMSQLSDMSRSKKHLSQETKTKKNKRKKDAFITDAWNFRLYK